MIGTEILAPKYPFFESAPERERERERERRGKERLGDGFGFSAYGTEYVLSFFFVFLIQQRLSKQQGNIGSDGATLKSCSWSLQ